MNKHRWKWAYIGNKSKELAYECLDCGAKITVEFEAQLPAAGCSGTTRPVATSTSGLYEKYKISRTDGEPIPEDARFFVLRIDRETDTAERAALRAYAEACKLRRPDLAQDLFALLANLPFGQ